ncbi:hypothetical protein SEA_FLATWOODS_63 [Gordonia phage Flatwoods]|uniref:Uncharacterized protein n=1 Tax=Gordonia phage Tangerine TaxID=2591120 RepID=A0A515ML20_9CAUD|nr:hypothetical protein J1767_gp63 [Gordonia phage Tangerine]QDM57362.1 hypothetical protein SEA_TANGERINE_63 [Gordonia phage Tangerine]UAJ15729.1 hypothetical protein SEA_BADDON_61 [Gordonia phage Baddon]URP21130.1 hypothetical protein SEA_FLATWOODS_63 [Gordonia phage Flatwoods]
MSSGQRPRRREYFPRMKVRGRHRRRRARITVYDSEFRALWPQPKLDGPIELASFLNGIAQTLNVRNVR